MTDLCIFVQMLLSGLLLFILVLQITRCILSDSCSGMTDCQASIVRMPCVRVYQISGYFLVWSQCVGYDRFPGIFFCVLFVQVCLMTRGFHVVTILQITVLSSCYLSKYHKCPDAPCLGITVCPGIMLYVWMNPFSLIL